MLRKITRLKNYGCIIENFSLYLQVIGLPRCQVSLPIPYLFLIVTSVTPAISPHWTIQRKSHQTTHFLMPPRPSIFYWANLDSNPSTHFHLCFFGNSSRVGIRTSSLEPRVGSEPTTSSLPRKRSTRLSYRGW